MQAGGERKKLFSSFPGGGAQFSRDVVAWRRRCPRASHVGARLFFSDWVVALRRHNRLRASLLRGGTVIFTSRHRWAAARDTPGTPSAIKHLTHQGLVFIPHREEQRVRLQPRFVVGAH